MRVTAVLSAAAVVAACAGPGRYDKAAAQFGAAATAGAAAARTALGGARETCRMRAWLHAVSDRFERPGAERGADPLAASSGVAAAGGGTITWREYCAELGGQDAALTAALTALEAYATALKEVAAQPGAPDAALATALATGVDGLAAGLGGSSTAAQSLAAPAGALARVVLDSVRARHLREAVLAGEAPLSTLLDGLEAYLDAAGVEVRDARSLARAVAREADAIIPVRAPDGRVPPELPGQALALYEFSRLELARLDAAEEQLAATRRLLAALREAHAALARGARAGGDDPAVSREVGAQVSEIVGQVLILRRLDWRSL
jgi:hypothetical protein